MFPQNSINFSDWASTSAPKIYMNVYMHVNIFTYPNIDLRFLYMYIYTRAYMYEYIYICIHVLFTETCIYTDIFS